jgi:twitching motility protein PilI
MVTSLLDELSSPIASTEALPMESVKTVDRQGYRIGQLQLLSQFNEASELLIMPTIYRLPGAIREIRGVTNLHGNVIPVFMLHERLGQVSIDATAHSPSQSQSQAQMLLVLGHGDKRAGVVIDGLPTRRKFLAADAAQVEDIPSQLQDYAQAAWRQADGLWVEFDHTSLLNELTADLRH